MTPCLWYFMKAIKVDYFADCLIFLLDLFYKYSFIYTSQLRVSAKSTSFGSWCRKFGWTWRWPGLIWKLRKPSANVPTGWFTKTPWYVALWDAWYSHFLVMSTVQFHSGLQDNLMLLCYVVEPPAKLAIIRIMIGICFLKTYKSWKLSSTVD